MISLDNRFVSQDGTIKYVWALHDGHRVETVYLRFLTHDSLCVSSQVGCNVGCVFCATGLDGLKRNLGTDEIVQQVEGVYRDRGRPTRRIEVSFMGMGEPLLNLKAVVLAVHSLNHSFPKVHFGLSTVGIVPKMYELASLKLSIQLQVSIHAANDEMRARLVPTRMRYPLRDILDASANYVTATGNELYLNYVLVSGINDTEHDAVEFSQLVKGLPAWIKISRLNPVEGAPYRPPDDASFTRFKEVCRDQGLNVYAFNSLGADVTAGCGQLRP